MRKLMLSLAAVAVLAIAFAANASAGDPPVHKAGTKTIQLGDNFFKPKTVTVKKGTTIKFKFNGFHNVEADGKAAFKNIPNRSSGTVNRKATKKGKFKLLCSIHDGMTMKLTVK